MRNDLDLTDPDFKDRARLVRRDIDAGVEMSFGEIADALGIDFDLFAAYLANEMFRQAPDLSAVAVCDPVAEMVH